MWFMNITKDELIELYIHQNLSKQAIADRYGCKQWHVIEKLNEYGIRKRHACNVEISKEDFYHYYIELNYNREQMQEKFNITFSRLKYYVAKYKIKKHESVFYIDKETLFRLYITENKGAT